MPVKGNKQGREKMKYTTTEKFYTTCPACGAAIGPSDKFCSYCGTRIVYERTETQEDTYSMDMNEVDIESKADPENSGAAGVFGIFFMIIWCCMAFVFTITFFELGGPVGVVPLLMFCFGIYNLVKMIRNRLYSSEIYGSAPRYRAMVLDHCIYNETRGSGKDRHTVTLAKVKVLAEMNGEQKVIMIKVGDPSNAAKYPEGIYVTIAGENDYFAIV